MRLKRLALTATFLTALLAPLPALAAYSITLTNGETITAESYRFGKTRVYLRYPVGEAAFDRSMVVAIRPSGQCPELLNVQAAPRQDEPVQPDSSEARQNVTPALAPVQAVNNNGASKTSDADTEEPVAALEPDPDPLAGQMDRFVNDYFSADPGMREALDKKMDGVFQTFFGEDAPVDETADY